MKTLQEEIKFLIDKIEKERERADRAETALMEIYAILAEALVLVSKDD